MNLNDQHKARLAEFDERYAKATTRCADTPLLLNTTKESREWFKSFLTSSYIAYIEAEIQRLEGLKKEQLDKNDPDNYGACYAIVGFNDCLDKQITYLREQLKEIK